MIFFISMKHLLFSFLIFVFFIIHSRCELFRNGNACAPGFFVNSSNLCDMCNYSCQNCSMIANNCTSCFGNDIYSYSDMGYCTPLGSYQ